MKKINYISSDLALIIPTRNRPNEVKRLLGSISKQDCELGRIIVIGSGIDISDIILSFKKKIPVEYYKCNPGQIKQRNKGISKLNTSTKLVGTIDDDVVFYKTAISEMIKFWNQVQNDTAGIGFNIVNQDGHKYSRLRGFFGVSLPEPGKVMKSGQNTSIINVKNNIRSEWLNGGTTVWKQDILKSHKHNDLYSRWAVYEDLIFSYPTGQKYPLYI